MKYDIGMLRLTRGTSGEEFQRFIGALEAGRQMLGTGDSITLRIFNDPAVEGSRGQSVPLGVFATIDLSAASSSNDKVPESAPASGHRDHGDASSTLADAASSPSDDGPTAEEADDILGRRHYGL